MFLCITKASRPLTQLKKNKMNKITIAAIALLYLSTGISQVGPASLKVCMPFTGNALDNSGNNNHGTVNGAVALTTDRFGAPNSAYHFTGSMPDNISINTFGGFIPNDELTISMWALSDFHTSACLFMLNPDNANDRCVGCAMYLTQGLVWDYGDIFTGGRLTLMNGYDQQWHHYVYVVSSSQNRQQIFMDGVLVATQPFAMTLVNRNLPLFIGAGTSSMGGGSLRWRGKIDDVCIWNAPASASDVGSIYANRNSCCDTIKRGGGGPEGRLTGIENLYKSDSYRFYGTAGLYQYAGDYTKLESVEVRSIDGKLIKKFEKSDITSNNFLDLTSVSQGIYLVTSFSSTERRMQKIVHSSN